MDVAGLILNIIGILLLVLIVLLILVLLYPISYKGEVDIDRKQGALRVNWLFRLIRFRAAFGEQASLVLSVVFFSLDFLDEKKKEKRKKKKAKKALKKQKKKEKKKKQTEDDPQEEKSKPEVLLDKVVTGSQKGSRLVTLVMDLDLPDVLFPGVAIFLYHLRLRTLKGEISFGFADPATTGRVTGVLAAIPAIYDTQLALSPDFETEETYVRGTLSFAGRLRLIHVVILLIRWMGQKEFRLFLSALKKAK